MKIELTNTDANYLWEVLFNALMKDYFLSERLTRKRKNCYRRIISKIQKELEQCKQK